MSVPILRNGKILIASFQSSLSDSDLRNLEDELSNQTVRHRAKAVVIDITALDVMDSFAARILSNIAGVLSLRGARTIIVGLQPDVAFSMVQMGLYLKGVQTALDLEEGLMLAK